MFAPNDLSQPNQAPGLETNNHDPSQFMLANMDFGRANLLICQKVAPEEEPEEKIKVPGDIKLLFDEMEEKLSEYDSEESPKANEKKEGELSPGGFNQNGSGVFRFSGFKGTNSFFSSKNPSSINGHSAVFMPNFNGNISNNSSRVAPMPQHDNLRDNKSTLSQSPKKLSESEESLMVQKLPFSSIKSSSTSNFFCPFCSQVVFYNDNSDCYAYNVAGSQKRYLAHAECYSGSHNNNTKISLASDISLAEINPKGGFLNNIMSTEKFEDIKKAYFIKLEGFHPISSSRLFKVEKVCNEIYKTTDELQFLHLNLDSQGTSFFEPASHTLPFSEFRLVITVYLTHSQEDAYKFEFNIDLSSYRDQNEEVKSKSIELSYSQGGRLNIMFGADVYSNLTKEDFNRKLPYKPQYYHPIFYNTLMTFKYFMIALPLKRIAKKKPAPQQPQPQTQADKVQQKAKAVLLSNSASFQKPSRLRIFQEHDTISQDNSKVFGHSSETFFDQKTSPLFPQMDTIKQTVPVQMTKSCLTADNSPTFKGPNARLNQTTTEEANVPPHFDVYTNNLSASDTFLDNNPNNTSKQGEDLDGEFRLEEYLDKLPQFAKTYRGSKILQEYLVKATKQELDKITIRIANNVVDLMLDPYANYMVQILAKHCASEQRLILLQKIAPSIVRIACDKKGTYALQTIVSLINSNPEDLLMKSALSQHILDLSMDSQGNHVIQKLINAVSLKNIDFIYQPLLENFLHVATHSAGSLVFKQLIIKVEKLVNLKTAIVQIVYQEMENLVQDPYGNYVIQYVLEYYPKDCGLVQQKIINKLIPYSSQKFSSNIIEKCLAVGDYTLRKKVAGEILKNERLSDLLKNKYGNYVILHTLAICDGEDKQSIMQGIHKCVYSFQGTKYKLRWVKFLEENPLNIPWNTSIQGNRSQTRFNAQNDMMNPFSENYDAKHAKEEDLKKLEIVKKIWRDMNKEEKREPSPKHSHSHSHSRNNNKQHQQQQNFNSFDDYSDSNGSPCQMETNAGNFYPEPYNFYMNANKMEDPRLKWF